MDQNELNYGDNYRIRVKGTWNHAITDWFDGITISPQENGETLLVGRFADQPALRGFLEQLWNFNCTVLFIERIENECTKGG